MHKPLIPRHVEETNQFCDIYIGTKQTHAT